MGKDSMMKTWKNVVKIIKTTTDDGIKLEIITPKTTMTEVVKPKNDELFSLDAGGNIEVRDYGRTRVIEFRELTGCSLERNDKNLILHCEKEKKKI